MRELCSARLICRPLLPLQLKVGPHWLHAFHELPTSAFFFSTQKQMLMKSNEICFDFPSRFHSIYRHFPLNLAYPFIFPNKTPFSQISNYMSLFTANPTIPPPSKHHHLQKPIFDQRIPLTNHTPWGPG